MLYIYFDKSGTEFQSEKLVKGVDKFFNVFFRREWMQHPLVNKMIEDVDKNKVIADCVYDSPWKGVISPMQLSGGVKALIMILSDEDVIIDATICGDNCAKWIEEISKIKDITIVLGYTMRFSEDLDAVILNNNKKVHGYGEYLDTYFEVTQK